MSNQSNDLNQSETTHHDDFKQKPEIENHYYQEPTSEEIIEDDSLQVLPYPKDDEFK